MWSRTSLILLGFLLFGAPAARAADPGFVLPAQQIGQAFASSFDAPGHIAMSPGGTAYSAYSDGNDPGNSNYVRVRLPGGTWGDPQRLTDKGVYGGNWVAADGENSATVYYLGPDADGYTRLLAQRIAPSGELGDPVTLSPPGKSVTSFAADGDGAGHDAVAFVIGNDLYARHRSAGTEFAPALNAQPLASNANGIGQLDVAVVGDGDTAVAWESYSDAGPDHHVAVLDTVILGGAITPVSSVANQLVDSVDLSGGPDGTAAAVFAQDGNVYVATRAAGGSFSPGVAAGPVATGIPRAAVNAAGKVYAGWAAPGAQGADITAVLATRPAGGALSAPLPISDGVGDLQDGPGLAVDGGGDVLMGWWQRNGHPGTANVYRGAFIPAGGTATVTTLNAGTINFASYFGIHGQSAIDAHGDGFVALIGDQAVDGTVLEGAPFDRGPLLSGLSVPSSGTAGTALAFGVSPVGVWSPVTGAPAWSFGDGATGTGAAATHTYAAAGAYPVTVSATNARGVTSSETRTVTVAAAPVATPSPTPVAVATPTPTPTPIAKPKVVCTVPTLTGKTLSAATSALKKAHCKLGKVTKPKGKKKLVVLSQSKRAKSKLTSGTKINLRLGTKPKKKSKH